jgi:hypothetical protein
VFLIFGLGLKWFVNFGRFVFIVLSLLSFFRLVLSLVSGSLLI